MEPRDRICGYSLIELIGTGMTGEVWLGGSVFHANAHAVKVMSRGIARDSSLRQRFYDVSYATCSLSHPGIVRLFFVGQERERYYWITDYVQGPGGKPHSLRDALSQAAGLCFDEERAFGLLREICQTLKYAHNRGVVHGSIKPSNVLLTEDGHIKVTDFALTQAIGAEFVLNKLDTLSGLSKNPEVTAQGPIEHQHENQESGLLKIQRDRASTQEFCQYMSPEQWIPGGKIDKRCDIYALGILIYRMLTGEHVNHFSRHPSDIVHGLSPAWDEIVANCLKKNPRDRYEAVDALMADLDRIHINETTVQQYTTEPESTGDLMPSDNPEPAIKPPYRADMSLSFKGFMVTGMLVCLAMVFFFGGGFVGKFYGTHQGKDGVASDYSRPEASHHSLSPETQAPVPVRQGTTQKRANNPELIPPGDTPTKNGNLEPSVVTENKATIHTADDAPATSDVKAVPEQLVRLKKPEPRIIPVSQDPSRDTDAGSGRVLGVESHDAVDDDTDSQDETVVTMSDRSNFAAEAPRGNEAPTGIETLILEPIPEFDRWTTTYIRLPMDLEGVSAESVHPADLTLGGAGAHNRQHETADQLKLPLEVTTNKTQIRLRLIPAGSFSMGSSHGEEGRNDDERLHRVTLTEPFYCGKYKITQGQWQTVMGTNPSHFVHLGPDAPVEQVSWWDSQAFLSKLCHLERVPQGTYYLPTEAQWEYACRAGRDTPYSFGERFYSDEGRPGAVNIRGKSTVCVEQSVQNVFGLYGMHENVYEWCHDWYGEYPSGRIVNPVGPVSGMYKVFRGGSWRSKPEYCRSASRLKLLPIHGWSNLGLRIARHLPSTPVHGR